MNGEPEGAAAGGRLEVPPRLLAAMLGVFTLLALWPVASCEFITFDDRDYYTNNPRILAGLSWPGVAWAFGSAHASNWHPLTWLSLMLDSQLFGRDPGGPHIVNLIFHTAAALLLFALLRRLTGAVWRSACVAALFAVHPLHVESVAWVTERKDVLSAFFFFLTLLAYQGYARRREAEPGTTEDQTSRREGRLHYWLALGCYVLGLLSKPMLVTTPFVLLLLDYWPLRRWDALDPDHWRSRLGRLAAEKAPFFILSAAVCVITCQAQQRAMNPIPFAGRIGNAIMACVLYLSNTFWPVKLAIFYPRPEQWPHWQVGWAAALLAGLLAAALWCGRRFPFLLMGWLWFLGMLVPVLGLLQVGSQARADRYTYLPLVGVLIALVWGVEAIRVRWRVSQTVVGVMAVLALAACAVRTRDQLSHWRTSERLFLHAIAVTHNNGVAYDNLACSLWFAGKTNEAALWYQKLLDLEPGSVAALSGLGYVKYHQGDYAGAAAYYSVAARLEPTNAVTELHLADALAAGTNLAAASDHYRTVLRLDPKCEAAHFNLACALVRSDQIQPAIDSFRAVLQLNPTNADAHNLLGETLISAGRTNEAMDEFNATLRIEPGYVAARGNLGDTWASLGNLDAAIAQYAEALKIAPESSRLHSKLGQAWVRAGRLTEARAEFTEALRLKPDDVEAQQALKALGPP